MIQFYFALKRIFLNLAMKSGDLIAHAYFVFKLNHSKKIRE